MHKQFIFVIIAIGLLGGLYSYRLSTSPKEVTIVEENTSNNEGVIVQEDDAIAEDSMKEVTMFTYNDFSVDPISHATALFHWGATVFYTDPVGGAEVFAGKDAPHIILLTDIHGDHLNAETLVSVAKEDTIIIAPQAVVDELPADVSGTVVSLANGEVTEQLGFSIEAIPMYNLPESEEAFHVKGRGNGYVITKDDLRVYVAGDTADIKEMRDLKNIDVAFVPMNLPYTMDVDTAADAVIEFAPRYVIPYHYRGTDGLSDVERFKALVEAGNENVEVKLLAWYQQ